MYNKFKKKFFILLLFLLYFALFSKETLVKEIHSKYSHIRIVDYGTLRSLLFVRDSGEEVVESTLDINSPQTLFLLYTQKMFASFLLGDMPKKVLLAGLGGGSMVHFLNYYFPKIQVDIVEIDPEIVKIAKEYFGLKDYKMNKVIIQDIYKFIKNSKGSYDVIFMDAFLKPSKETDSTGVNLKQKEKEFFEDLKKNLTAKGVVAFNINYHKDYQKDIQAMKENFPNIYIFHRERSGNIIVLCSIEKERYSKEFMQKRGEWIDKEHKTNFSFLNLTNFYLGDKFTK
ncbi:MAG: fused MFS/spermidine synthase [Leptospiraceae bacterium]|nr:fused MFS/spermidine synthase [Leptospiraceae bacterium]